MMLMMKTKQEVKTLLRCFHQVCLALMVAHLSSDTTGNGLALRSLLKMQTEHSGSAFE